MSRAGAGRIFTRIADDMRVMAAPVLAANPDGFAIRLDGLLKALPAASDGSAQAGGRLCHDESRA